MRSTVNHINAIDMVFIVRTVGERTEDLCTDLIERYRKDSERLYSVRRATHVDAIQQTLELAAEQSMEWVVAVDADMLLYPDALSKMRMELSSVHENASVVHFAVSDKLYRMKRWGVTVYRKSAAAEGAAILRELRQKPSLKIERALIKRLEDAGRLINFSKTDVALHDFYQYYSDLYRKAYLNAVRNPAITQRAKKVWRKVALKDPDYVVILKGTQDALEGRTKLSNSVGDFDKAMLKDIVNSLGLEEKPPLTAEVFGRWDMDSLVRDGSASIRKNKVARDFFQKGAWDRVRLRASRYIEYMRSHDTPE